MSDILQGEIYIEGQVENVKTFVKRFAFRESDDQQKFVAGHRHFINSEIPNFRDEVINMISIDAEYCAEADRLEGQETEDVHFKFPCEFTDSIKGSILDGALTENQDECITLQEACILDKISVTCILYNRFIMKKESVICEPNGKLDYFLSSVVFYTCNSCYNHEYTDDFDVFDEEKVKCKLCGSIDTVYEVPTSNEFETESRRPDYYKHPTKKGRNTLESFLNNCQSLDSHENKEEK